MQPPYPNFGPESFSGGAWAPRPQSPFLQGLNQSWRQSPGPGIGAAPAAAPSPPLPKNFSTGGAPGTSPLGYARAPQSPTASAMPPTTAGQGLLDTAGWLGQQGKMTFGGPLQAGLGAAMAGPAWSAMARAAPPGFYGDIINPDQSLMTQGMNALYGGLKHYGSQALNALGGSHAYAAPFEGGQNAMGVQNAPPVSAAGATQPPGQMTPPAPGGLGLGLGGMRWQPPSLHGLQTSQFSPLAPDSDEIAGRLPLHAQGMTGAPYTPPQGNGGMPQPEATFPITGTMNPNQPPTNEHNGLVNAMLAPTAPTTPPVLTPKPELKPDPNVKGFRPDGANPEGPGMGSYAPEGESNSANPPNAAGSLGGIGAGQKVGTMSMGGRQIDVFRGPDGAMHYQEGGLEFDPQHTAEPMLKGGYPESAPEIHGVMTDAEIAANRQYAEQGPRSTVWNPGDQRQSSFIAGNNPEAARGSRGTQEANPSTAGLNLAQLAHDAQAVGNMNMSPNQIGQIKAKRQFAQAMLSQYMQGQNSLAAAAMNRDANSDWRDSQQAGETERTRIAAAGRLEEQNLRNAGALASAGARQRRQPEKLDYEVPGKTPLDPNTKYSLLIDPDTREVLYDSRQATQGDDEAANVQKFQEALQRPDVVGDAKKRQAVLDWGKKYGLDKKYPHLFQAA